MQEKKLFREYERVEMQEKLLVKERGYMLEQLAATKKFLETISPVPKMREKFLHPSKGSRAIIRDPLQKQILLQIKDLEKSIAAYHDELIGLDTKLAHLSGVVGTLKEAVGLKDAHLVTDAAASHVRHAEKNAGKPPNLDKHPMLLPRCTWLQKTAAVMEDAGFVYKNGSRAQVHSASVRRSRGMIDEKIRLKIIEMIQRSLGKSDLSRPYLEKRLEECTLELDKAMATLQHLHVAVKELEPPMEEAILQEMMRNQRPFSEYVDDSGTRALKVEQAYWAENMAKQVGAKEGVALNFKKLLALQTQLKKMVLDDTGKSDTDKVVKDMLAINSPIPSTLLETVNIRKSAVERAGQYPSNHHVVTSHRLPEGSFGQRAISALDSLPKHAMTMPRLGKHLTMTSNFVDLAPPGFWQPPSPAMLKGKGTRSRTSKAHHLPSLDAPQVRTQALVQGR